MRSIGRRKLIDLLTAAEADAARLAEALKAMPDGAEWQRQVRDSALEAHQEGREMTDERIERVVIAERLAELAGYDDVWEEWLPDARAVLHALRAAGIPVGWDDVRERLLTDDPLDAAVATMYPDAYRPSRSSLQRSIAAAIDCAHRERTGG